MNKLELTKISLDDFKKLGLKGYEHKKYYYNESGQKIPYEETYKVVPEQIVDGVLIKEHNYYLPNCYSKVLWQEVDLSQKVEDKIRYIKQENPEWLNRYIVIAIHKDIDLKRLERYYKETEGMHDVLTGKLLTEDMRREEAFHRALYDYSYLDKYSTPQGAQTYLLSCGVKHLYSVRDYFYEKDTKFRIAKTHTKAVYLIKVE